MADEMNINSTNAGTAAINEVDPEITAMSVVYGALKGLDLETQKRVLTWIAAKLNLVIEKPPIDGVVEKIARASEEPVSEAGVQDAEDTENDGDNDGISAVSKKWMRRNALQTDKLSSIFGLGIDEIDLVARTVPGKSKSARMHNVFLLKGVAAYLGTGIARFTHEQVKEALTHYDAFDTTNFASYFKTFSVDVAGNKTAGYTLTARGLTNATALLKEMAP